MIPGNLIIDLLNNISANNGTSAFINEEELNQYPSAEVTALKLQKLILKAPPTSSAICNGCEENCTMDVHILAAEDNRPARTFVACDKRDDISRVPISLTKLTQWQCNADSVCDSIAFSLEIRRSTAQSTNPNQWNIGIFTGNKRSQMLCLQAKDELTIVAGSKTISLSDALEFKDDEYFINKIAIRQLVDTAITADNRYTPSHARQEVGKMTTKALYASWHKEYLVLNKKKPGMTDVWYSQQIAKMDIAEGRNYSTIKKNMLR
jgi:hypothetical protein